MEAGAGDVGAGLVAEGPDAVGAGAAVVVVVPGLPAHPGQRGYEATAAKPLPRFFFMECSSTGGPAHGSPNANPYDAAG